MLKRSSLCERVRFGVEQGLRVRDELVFQLKRRPGPASRRFASLGTFGVRRQAGFLLGEGWCVVGKRHLKLCNPKAAASARRPLAYFSDMEGDVP